MFDTTTILVTLIICAPALVLASQKSNWLIDYLFFVVALNRGIRRIVDYNNGYFNQFSLISLTPIIVGGLATLVVLIELNSRREQFGYRALKVLYLYTGLTAVAFLVGFVNAKFGAVYALGDYIAPIGLMGYAALHTHDLRLIARWGNSFALSALVVAIYGLWQFYTIPPWDKFWLIQVNFVGYMGVPEPGKMSLFSTMAERGPAAMYLCGGVMLLALRPGTLSILRWPAVILIGYAMLLTNSRTTVIFAGLAVVLFPVLNRGASLITVSALVVGAIVFGPSLLSHLPGQAAARVGSISSIEDDGSFVGRVGLLGHALSNSITEPLGLGIGSHGMASRVAKAAVAGGTDSTGYIENLRTYGWIGFGVFVFILWKIWESSRDLVKHHLDDADVRIFRSWFLAGMAALFSGNWLAGASFFWVLAGHSLGLHDTHFAEGEVENDMENEYYGYATEA